jgi:hypothetical protein
MAMLAGVNQKFKGQFGLAYLELSAWCVVMLPVALLAAGTVGLLHDLIRMQQVPVSAVREYSAPAMRIVDGGTRLEVNTAGLSSVIQSMRDRIMADSTASLVGGVTNISAMACFWVFRVDENTGRLFGPQKQVCERGGDLANTIALSDHLMTYSKGVTGYPISSQRGRRRYLEYAVLVGGAVAGRLKAIAPMQEGKFVQFVHVSLPREEVSL